MRQRNKINTADAPRNPCSSPIVLLGHIFELGLGAVEKSFAGETSGTYGYTRLIYVIAFAQRVINDAQGYFDTLLLMGLQNGIKCIVDRKQKYN